MFCPFSASSCWESFAVGLELFSQRSNPDLVVFYNTTSYRSNFDFTVSTWNSNALVDVLVFSTSELPAIVIASRLLIRQLIRELQLVYLNLLDLVDNHLDVLHDHLLGGPFNGDFD